MIQLLRNTRNETSFENKLGSPEVLSYEEYITLARIPHCEGVSARVVNALQARVGHSDLSIEDIATDLGFSKRTLQRRLKEQNAIFAQLRDDVRFHYSIKYLLEDEMKLNAVSSALDFSDRTSFTNAFKRWTGLSPNVFRKLFRDYV